MLSLRKLLSEILVEELPPDIFKHQISNPRAKETGKPTISIKWALQFPPTDPAHKAARQYLMSLRNKGGSSEEPISGNTGSIDSKDSNSAPKKRNVLSATQADVAALHKFVDRGGDLTINMLSNDVSLDALEADPFNKSAKQIQKQLDNVTFNSGIRVADVAKAAMIFGEQLQTDEKTISIDIPKDPYMNGTLGVVTVGITPFDSNSTINISGEFRFVKDDPDSNSLYANYVIMDDTRKGSKDAQTSAGLRPSAPKLLKHAMEACDAVGIKNISFHAGLEAGGFIWAKLGAKPDTLEKGQINRIKNRLRDLIEEVEQGDAADLNRFYLTGNPDLDKKLALQAINRIQKMKAQGEYEANMELLTIIANELPNDPSLITVIANHDLGRFLLQGANWTGSFDITPGSESREYIDSILTK